ncbi:MAG: SulP family inorganic anion transporter, partial [Flavobacteriaceae bacterium]|nr:SulP family inorganic anion transporter [Flavobacteriaceae bacterium]
IITSLFFYLDRTSKPNIAELALNKDGRLINKIRDEDAKECSSMKIVRIDGSIYFGSIEKIADYFTHLYDENLINYILIAGDGINFIDLAAAEWLTYESFKWKKNRGGIYIAGLKLVSQDVLKNGGFKEQIGQEFFFKDKKSAIIAIHNRLDKPCLKKAFEECY